MKFTLIFGLCLCVFSAQALPAPPGDNSEQIQKNGFESFLSNMAERIRKLLDDTGKMIALIAQLTDSIIRSNTEKINQHWDEIMDGLSKLQGEEARKCISDIMPELKNAREILKVDIKECYQPLINESETLKDQINAGVTEIKNTGTELTKKFTICLALAPPRVPKCISGAIKSAKTVVNEFFKMADEKVGSVFDNALQAADKAAMCILNSFLRFDKIVNKKTQEAMVCIAEVPKVQSF